MAFKNVLMISLIFAFLTAEVPVMLAQTTQVIPHLLSIVQVTLNGLRNTVTGRPITNITSPFFTDALAQVNIGTRPVGLGVTDSTGSVNITLSPTMLLTTLPTLVNNLLNNGTIRILTPVATANATLPTLLIQSSLQLLGNITTGLLNITRLGPIEFNLTV